MSILFKLTIVPFNAWSVEAYEGMPFYVTIFVSILPKFVIYIIFIRLTFLFSDLLETFPLLLDLLNFSSILIGGVGGLFETEIMRIISFSSTANLGFLFSIIQTPELSNVVPALVFLISYLLLLINMFSLAYSLNYDLINDDLNENIKDSSYISNIHDLTFFKGTHPFYAILLSFSVISFAGLPPFAGFFSKFFLLWSLIESYSILSAFIMLLLTTISAGFYLSLIINILFQDELGFRPFNILSASSFSIIYITSLFNIFFIAVFPIIHYILVIIISNDIPINF